MNEAESESVSVTAAFVCAADAVLAQADELLEALDDGELRRPCRTVMGGTIGQHLRHSLDHFNAAVGAWLQPERGTIDYDHRAREVPMERSCSAAREAIKELRAALASLDADVGLRTTSVRVMLNERGGMAAAVSTFARELAFVTHHALHHHAMIKIIADAHGISTPAGFGKAPSTLRHEHLVEHRPQRTPSEQEGAVRVHGQRHPVAR